MGSKPTKPKLFRTQSAPVCTTLKVASEAPHRLSQGKTEQSEELTATDNDMLMLHEIWATFLRVHKNDIAATAFLRLFMSRPQLKRVFRLSTVPAGDLINHELFQSHMSRFALFLDTVFSFLEKGKNQENLKALLIYVDGLGRAHAHIGKSIEKSLSETDRAIVFDSAYWRLFAENLLDIIREMLVDKNFSPLKYYNAESPDVILGKLSCILGFVVGEMRKALASEAAQLSQG